MENKIKTFTVSVIIFFCLFVNASVFAESKFFYLNHEKISETAINYIVQKHPDISRKDIELSTISLRYDTKLKKNDKNVSVCFYHITPTSHSMKVIDNKTINRKKKKYICLVMNPDGQIIKESLGTTSSNSFFNNKQNKSMERDW